MCVSHGENYFNFQFFEKKAPVNEPQTISSLQSHCWIRSSQIYQNPSPSSLFIYFFFIGRPAGTHRLLPFHEQIYKDGRRLREQIYQAPALLIIWKLSLKSICWFSLFQILQEATQVQFDFSSPDIQALLLYLFSQQGFVISGPSAMLKQILSKIPRKSPKSDPLEATVVNDNGGSSFSSRLNVVKRVSSAVFPSSIMAGVDAVEPHLSFKDVSAAQKQNLFVSKLNLCCEIPDYCSDPDKTDTLMDIKREALVELVDFVSSGSATFTEPAIAAMCKMFTANLFRVFPPKFTEDEEPMFDPAWSYLQIVYDLLLRFTSLVDAKMAKKHIDHAFVSRVLDLFDSDDPRERECLKTVLHGIYGKFMIHRPFIRKGVSNIIYRFVYETERHNGIAELLEIFGSVISGFALPLKEEHKLFLLRALLPLHKPKSVGIYHQQLTFCVVQFVDKDPKLAGSVIKGLLKYWPLTNSQKELMFISEMEEILEMTSMDEFQMVMVPLFRRLGGCLNSSHYQVAERAHLLWNNERIVNHLIVQNREVIIPIIFTALEHNSQNHWNQAVLNLTQYVRKIFLEMDEELMMACQHKLEEEHWKPNVVAEKRRLTWENLENAAGTGSIINSPISSLGMNIAQIEPATTCSVAC